MLLQTRSAGAETVTTSAERQAVSRAPSRFGSVFVRSDECLHRISKERKPSRYTNETTTKGRTIVHTGGWVGTPSILRFKPPE